MNGLCIVAKKKLSLPENLPDFLPGANRLKQVYGVHVDGHFNGVLPRFTIWSILLELKATLSMGLLRIGPPRLN